MPWINKERIACDVGLRLQLGRGLVRIAGAHVVAISVIQRIEGGRRAARRRHEKSHAVESHDVPADFALGLAEEGGSTPVFCQRITDQDSLRFIVHDHRFKQTSRDDVPLQPDIGLARDVDPVIIVVDEVPYQNGL